MAVIDDFDDEEERKRRSAAGVPVFSRDTIASDCWTAIYLAIPAGDPELMKYAMDTAMRCASAVCGPPNPSHPFAPVELGADKTQSENLMHAVRRIDDLGYRLREAERVELRETVEAQINAADRVVENWSSGDLAGAVNELEETAEAARETLRTFSPEPDRSLQPDLFAEPQQQEPMTIEAIERDPWNAVTLDLPPDASPELLSLVQKTAGDLKELAGRECMRTADPHEEQRWRDLYDAALDRSALAWNRLLEQEPMTIEAIEANQWAAVDRPIPGDANSELLLHAREAAARCVDDTENYLRHDYETSEEFDQGLKRLQAARERRAELDARILEPMTIEAIEANPWAAVQRAIPGDAGSELLLRARAAATRCAADMEDYVEEVGCADEMEFDQCMGEIRAARERVVELHERLLQRELKDIEVGLARGDRISLSAEPMTIEAIERDRTNAIRLDIPADADRELLSLVATTARELRHDYIERANQTAPGELADALFEWGELAKGTQKDAETTLLRAAEEANLVERILIEAGDMHSHYDIGEWEGGYAVFRTYEIDDEMLPEYGLPSAVQKLGEAATLPELHRAIIDGSALTAYPLWISEDDRSHETNLWSPADLDLEAVPRIETREQLAELIGQVIDALDDAPSLAERVQQIIEHPELEAGVQDERVLEALAERREELGLAEPLRRDDEREAVYSADAPEPTQSSASGDAAEVDYLFGREEMTEAKSAAYDRWTGQEIGGRSQEAGQVQDPTQSQSQGRSRSR